MEFAATNNDAEYEAVIVGLELALEIGANSLCLHSDSQFIVNQILGEFQAREERLTAYLKKTKLLLDQLDHYLIKHIPREENQEADGLAKQASMRDDTISAAVAISKQLPPSFEQVNLIAAIREETWMPPIQKYLQDGTLPDKHNEVKKM